MKHIILLSALTIGLTAFSVTAMAQNVTVHKQGGVGHVYEKTRVDSVVYFPIGDKEPFPSAEETNTTTLWDIIKAQPNLKRFATILETATYYKNRFNTTGVTFSKLLAGSTAMNVYAPSDAAISNTLYAKLLSQAKTEGWKLQQEFIANHISPQESPSAGTNVVTMLNSKLFKRSAINISSENTQAACGSVYVLSSVLPYTPNLREYLMETADNCSEAQQFMAEADSMYFDLTKSITAPSTDGGLQILDSAYSHYQPLMAPFFIDDQRSVIKVKGFGKDLSKEDANYKMVMPTNQLWDDALAKLEPLYKYSIMYEDKIKGDLGSSSRIALGNPDSISALSMGADILVPLLGRTSTSQSTSLSNGTAYFNSTWPVPASQYKPDVEVEIEDDNIFYNKESSKYRVGPSTTCVSFGGNLYSQITNKYGHVSNNNFYYLNCYGPSNGPRVEIKLQGKNGEQVMSGKYDIQVVVVPRWYVDIYYASTVEDYYLNPESQEMQNILGSNKYKFKTQITYCSGNSKDKTLSFVTNVSDGTKVDTITVAQDFEFPYSYKNITCSYPTLYIECATSKTDAKNGYIYDLCIDKIILKSKEDGSETEVTP